MQSLRSVKFLFVFISFFGLSLIARAEEGQALNSTTDQTNKSLETTSPAQSEKPTHSENKARPRRAKGRIPREKEAEGTRAPKQFNADSIPKSIYKDERGQSLEVDPD